MKLSTNDDMVEYLNRKHLIRSDAVKRAFLQVDRGHFVEGKECYLDTPLPIGFGQTISAPHMVAIMTEELDLRKGMKVLEIGAGSGYQAAVIATLVDPAKVFTVERVPELVDRANRALERAGVKNVEVLEGDGSNGLPKEAPFDRIIATCAAPDVPQPLIDQLGEEGMLLVPVGGRGYQELIEITRIGGKVVRRKHGGCVFVPMLGKHAH